MAGRGRELRRLNKSVENPGKNSDSVKEGQEFLAKFTYKSNPEQPGGFKELDLKQGERVWLIKMGHGENHHWWMVEKEDHTSGYVPGDYLLEMETEVTSLPWLKNKEPEKDITKVEGSGSKFGVPDFKPYVSAYGGEENSEYFCKVCARNFNGPTPYKAHMSSKAHKQEVELAKEYGRL